MRWLPILLTLSLLLPVAAGENLFATIEVDDTRQFTVLGSFQPATNTTHASLIMTPQFRFEDEDWTYTNVSGIATALVLENGTVHKQGKTRDTQLEPGEAITGSLRLPIDVERDKIAYIRFAINHTAVRPGLGKYFSVRTDDFIEDYIHDPSLTIGTNTSRVNQGEGLWINGTIDAETLYIGGTELTVTNGTFQGWIGTDDLPGTTNPTIPAHTGQGAIMRTTLPVEIAPRKPQVSMTVPDTVENGTNMSVDIQVDKPVDTLTITWQDWSHETSSDGTITIPTQNASTGLYRFEVAITDTDGISVTETAGFEIVTAQRYQEQENGDGTNGTTEDEDDDQQEESEGLPLVRGFRTFVEGLIANLLGIEQ